MEQITVQDLKIAHDFKHVGRVRCWALEIAKRECFKQEELIEATCLLHDIGLAHVTHRQKHASVGAEIASHYLQDTGLFEDQKIGMIASAIRCHISPRGGGKLGDILRDADKLDMFGAVGIMRACTSKYTKPEYDTGNIKGDTWGKSANEFDIRFAEGTGVGSYIVDQINFQISCYEQVKTRTAQAFAKPLVEFMKRYMIQLDNEIQGTVIQEINDV